MFVELLMASPMRSFGSALLLSTVAALLLGFLFSPLFAFIVSHWNLSAVAP